jgi:tetratricopeptide (TPR) repeat protein
MANPPEMDVEALLEAGLARHRAGERDAAETLFRRAIAAAPDEPTALYLLGLARFEAGDSEEAGRLLARVVALRPGHVQARVTLANLRHWGGLTEAAEADYRAVIALAPEHVGALIGLAQVLEAAGDHAGALDAATRATELQPANAGGQLTRGATLASLGRPAEAAAAYRLACDLAPDQAMPHLGLALALLQADETEAAEAAAERAVTLDETSSQAWFALGAARRGMAQPDTAIAALERAIALDPANIAAHLSLGALYVELEKPPLAETHLRRAMEIDPASKEAHANLSSLYLRADRLEEARDHALRAIELDPQMTVAHQNLAGMLAREGQDEEARRHRDAAYAVRNLFITTAARPLQRVLVLTTTESGNIPERYLLPADRYTRLSWFIEYATPGQMSALPPYDVVFNAIGDQDLTGPTARNMAAFMAVCAKPVFNRPEAVEQTSRDLAPARYGDIEGVVTPAVARLDGARVAERGLLAAAADAGIAAPMLVRPIGSHGGQGLTLISADAAATGDFAPPAPGRDHYVTAFHDFRAADGFYRKYRVIFVDRVPYPYHLAIGPDWMVHYETSGTADDPVRLAEEVRFLDDPAAALGQRAMAAVTAIGKRLDLDFCGVDFSLLPDGRVLLFEANATMLVHPEDPDGPLAHKNPTVERILAAFRAMLAA